MGKTKIVYVTSAEKKAAQILIRRAQETGQQVKPNWIRIANAERAPQSA